MVKLRTYATLPALLFAATMMVAGCDAENPTEPDGPTFADVQEQIFTTYCSGCHSGSDAPADLDLTDGASYASIVNVPSVQVPGLMRVEPGNASDSYLYIKIIGGDRMAPGTFQMPIGSELSDDQIRLVEEWIEAGAES